MTKTTVILGWMYFSISTLFALLSVYSIIKFAQLSRNEECCDKRRVWILCDALFVVAAVLLQSAYLCRPEVYDIPPAHVTSVAILFAFVFAGLTVFAEQIWLVYYQINLSKAINKEKWQKIINNQLNTNWFINNSHKYGNRSPRRFFIGFAFVGMN